MWIIIISQYDLYLQLQYDRQYTIYNDWGTSFDFNLDEESMV